MNTTKDIKDFCKQVGITPNQFRGEKVINGNLCIDGDITIPSGFTPKVAGYMDLRHVTSIPSGFAPKVGSILYLNNAIIIGDDFTPIVGTILNMPKLITIGNNFAPVVGSDLILSNVNTLPTNAAPIVGGSLFLKDKKINGVKKLVHDGKYIIADNMLTEVVSKQGNAWKVKCIGKDQIFYLVTDGFGNFAYGNTLSIARDSLIIKYLTHEYSR